MLLFQFARAPAAKQVKTEAAAFFTISCKDPSTGAEKSPQRINHELAAAYRKLGYGNLADLVRVSEPEGKTKKYTRLYLEMDQWVHMEGMKEGETTNRMSLANRSGRENILEIRIALVGAPGEAERLKITLIYPPGGDPPDVLAISPKGYASYHCETGGMLVGKPESNFMLGKAAKDGR